ncbi:oxidized low-density lipoprotein receptor 1 [Diachasma alloeum]|uniref:oxidized low-density lipoprotein receptor 1 n=1 Tax=Diachasma alloeum TaxID=454923 RepID=UPI0007381B7D|nr:oxidized low-density lipoprotein receptor 1 [Diachasma alloeum]
MRHCAVTFHLFDAPGCASSASFADSKRSEISGDESKFHVLWVTMRSILLVTLYLVLPAIHCDGNRNNGVRVGVFSQRFEDWVVSMDERGNSRESRDMKFGNRSIVVHKIVTPNKREVSETDLYLLGAIEKLLYKVEGLEKRLRRAEELLYYVISGNSTREEPCPTNYTRIGKGCYYISSREYDWKSSASLCRSLGGNLLELETPEEYKTVKNHLQTTKGVRGFDFWTGGLNPGLLWIWASSAKAVFENQVETVDGYGRCLKIRNSIPKNYSLYGEECIKKLRYICKPAKDDSTNEVEKIERGLEMKRKSLH